MFLPNAGRTLYLDLYHIVRTHTVASSQCRRSVSTTSAINRGIRASRDTRARSRDGGRAGGRAGGRDRPPVAPAPTTRDRATRLRGDGLRGTAFARSERAAAGTRAVGRRTDAFDEEDAELPSRRSAFTRDRVSGTRERSQRTGVKSAESASFRDRGSGSFGRSRDRTTTRSTTGRKAYEVDDEPEPRYANRERAAPQYASREGPSKRFDTTSRHGRQYEEDGVPTQRQSGRDRNASKNPTREYRRSRHETEEPDRDRSHYRQDTDRSLGGTPQSKDTRLARPNRNEPAVPRSSTNTDDRSSKRKEKDAKREDYESPMPIPYTTAASQFLYGTNVVHAALKSQRRKLYRLHLQQRSTAPNSILRMAEKAKIPIDRNASVRFLDTVSDNRPHNGVVLDASRLPAPPVLALGRPDAKTGAVGLTLDRQSAEDMLINGSSNSLNLPARSQASRHPFVIMLDGILDEGNLGSIMRTAHFYGADAIAVATATCASINSPIVAKASSGACEAVTLLALPKPSSFVLDSAKAGWKVYAAVAPGEEGSGGHGDRKQIRVSTSAVASEIPLREAPAILMLGAEGEGLRASLVNKAHYLISVERGAVGEGVVDVGVDSLNVGVAAGVLMEAFLRSAKDAVAVEADTTSPANTGKSGSGDLGF